MAQDMDVSDEAISRWRGRLKHASIARDVEEKEISRCERKIREIEAERYRRTQYAQAEAKYGP